MKVNKEKLTVDLEEQNDSVEWEELVDELPDSAPRFVAYRYVILQVFVLPTHYHAPGASRFPLRSF